MLILICWGPALLAQVGASQSPPAHPDSALATALAALPGDRIVLDDAVAAALEQSAAAREAEARYAVARAALRRERGVFDPELYASWRYSDNQAPTASFFSGASVLQTEETTLAGGLRWQLHTGTRLEAALNSVRLNTNSSFAFLNPQYDAFGSITVRQSLLSGLWIGGRRDLAAAEREAEAARARRDRAILAVRGDVERAYWDLYAGERDLAVQELIVERARVLLEEARVRAASGLVGPNQVANARVFLAEQELNRLDANERLAALSDALAARIGRRPPGGERYRSVDRPAVTTAIPATDDLLATAMEANPELEALRGDIETFSVQARAAGWDVLPRLDLVGTIGGSGLAGNARPVVFGSDTLRTTVSGGQGDAISEALSRDFPNWSVGVELSIPIGARSERAQRDRLRAEMRAAEARFLDRRRTLETEVRAAVRDLANGVRRETIARDGVNAAQEQVRVGMIEYRNGRTTAFELVRLAADLAVAQQRYSQALVRSAKAAVTLRELTAGAWPPVAD